MMRVFSISAAVLATVLGCSGIPTAPEATPTAAPAPTLAAPTADWSGVYADASDEGGLVLIVYSNGQAYVHEVGRQVDRHAELRLGASGAVVCDEAGGCELPDGSRARKGAEVFTLGGSPTAPVVGGPLAAGTHLTRYTAPAGKCCCRTASGEASVRSCKVGCVPEVFGECDSPPPSEVPPPPPQAPGLTVDCNAACANAIKCGSPEDPIDCVSGCEAEVQTPKGLTTWMCIALAPNCAVESACI